MKAYFSITTLLIGTAILWTSFSGHFTPEKSEYTPSMNPPNFVFILADDMGWNGTSALIKAGETASQSDFYETPNIDQLALEGMTFSQGYAPAPKCSPSRNSILTGQTTARNQFTETGNSIASGEILIEATTNTTIDVADVTIGEWLHSIGSNYRTAHYGKWHLGSGGTVLNNGFDEGDGATTNAEGDAADGMVIQADPKRIFDITNKGMDFMDQAVTDGVPFYLQLSHYAVHSSIETRAATQSYYAGKTPGTVHDNVSFAAMTQDLDTGIGQIMQKIDDLGIENDTYIIFMSDNGGASMFSSNGILRAGKLFLFEGGLRVPFIIKGPNVTANVHSDEPVVGYDLFPTIAELSQGTAALPNDLDGTSLVPLLSQTSINRTEPLYFHSPHYVNAGLKKPRSAIIEGNYKFIVDYESCSNYLFDLDANIRERDMQNLISSNPTLATDLTIKLRNHLKSVNANMPSLNAAHAMFSGNGGTSTDVDADGLDDVWEFRELLCFQYNATDDPDGDGLTNAQEMAEGTDPLTRTTIFQIKTFLQGPYNGSDMNTDLQNAGLLPLTDPYGLGVTVPSIPADVVDWVKVELRDATNTATVLAEYACFLRKDGELLDSDGKLGLRFENVGATSAYVAVRHRNHLGAMLNDVVNFN